MVEGLRDGSIDVIADRSRAASLPTRRRWSSIARPFGIVGWRPRLAVLRPAGSCRRHRLPRLVELLSTNPARVLGLPGGTLTEGARRICRSSRRTRRDRHASALRSKSKNTPFDGWTLKGAVAATIVGGRVVYANP
jgi:dihydroorotase